MSSHSSSAAPGAANATPEAPVSAPSVPAAAPKKKDADYVFLELTRSICPGCRKVVDAHVIVRDNKVIMRKRCSCDGGKLIESLVYSDAQAYITNVRYNKPGTIPLAFNSEVKDGCPHDCGLCPDHQQHACLGIIEVNSVCNMDCPLCFAEAGPGFSLTMEEVVDILDNFVRAEGRAEVVQFSGGEPTVHPQIIDFIKAAQERDINLVMINTNGKRIAKDDKFLEELAPLNIAIYFQFDGFSSETYRIIRGEPNILEEKIKALDRLASIGKSVVLVPAIERGVNDHEVGEIVKFAMKHPAVRGINFQPAFHAGRHMDHDPMQRMTIPDILAMIETQTEGMFKKSDFVPVPCCFPTCNSVSYAFAEGDTVLPITRVVNVYDYLDYISNRVMPDYSAEIKLALEGLWSSSAVPGGQKSAEDFKISCQSCGIPDVFSVGEIASRMKMIMLQDFMDPWTFNQKNLMKCCKEFLLPGGKQVPFCSYNTIGYREQAREQLEEMEWERKLARKEGRPFQVKPVTFSFNGVGNENK
jgi:uncharacterized radical SAM superfamily Fe-S cluster-containing enzyme